MGSLENQSIYYGHVFYCHDRDDEFAKKFIRKTTDFVGEFLGFKFEYHGYYYMINWVSQPSEKNEHISELKLRTNKTYPNFTTAVFIVNNNCPPDRILTEPDSLKKF